MTEKPLITMTWMNGNPNSVYSILGPSPIYPIIGIFLANINSTNSNAYNRISSNRIFRVENEDNGLYINIFFICIIMPIRKDISDENNMKYVRLCDNGE